MSGDPFWQVIAHKGLRVDPAVKALHAGLGERRFIGRADVTRGTHPIVRAGLWASGFPPEGRDVPLLLTLTATEHYADWERDFDGHKTFSRLWFDTERVTVSEKLGPFRLTLDLRVAHGKLIFDVSGFSLWGISMPAFLHPISETTEFENEEGQFAFDVSGRLPGLGLIIHYTGHLRALPNG